MRFLTIYKPDAALTKRNEAGVPPSKDEIARMGAFIEEMSRTGHLVSTEGCQASSKGARVRRSGGKFIVTDGPFTESKELIAGFAIIEAKSKAEAIELTKRFLDVAGDGESEIRQLHEPSDFGPA